MRAWDGGIAMALGMSSPANKKGPGNGQWC